MTYKLKTITVLFFAIFTLLENIYSQPTLKCQYNWDLLEIEDVIMPIEDLFSSNDSSAVLNIECISTLIEKIKHAKTNGMYLSYTLYNETSKFKIVNLHFYKVLYEYFLAQGIEEDDIFASFNSPLELPPPVFEGKFVMIEDLNNIENKSYLSFSLEVNME